MSLINEMLQDLEARRAGELAKPDLQREIRPLPERRAPYPTGFVVAVAGFVTISALGGVAWWRIGEHPVKAVTTEAVAAAPATGLSPLSAQATPPVEVSAVTVTEALRLAEELSNPPAEDSTPPKPQAPSPEGYKAPAKPPTVHGRMASSLASVDGPPATPGGIAVAPPVQGHIEKTVVLGSPREKADAEFRQAQSLFAAGAAPAVVADALRGALKQDGTYNPARQMLLRILLDAQRVDEAMALLQEGLERQPAQIGWAMSLARLQVERGGLAAAEGTLARFAAQGAGNAEYVGFRGHLLNRNGQFREGAEQYAAATRMAPADGRWWFGLGQALEGGGRNDEARGAYRRALETGTLNPDLTALAEQKVR